MFIVLNKDKLVSCFISFSIVAIILTIGFFYKKNYAKSITQREAERKGKYQTQLVYTKNYENESNIK